MRMEHRVGRGGKSHTSALSHWTSSSSLFILSSYSAFSSRIIVVSTSLSHNCSRSLRNSRAADNSRSFPRTRISPEVSAPVSSGPASLSWFPPLPIPVGRKGDDASLSRRTSAALARCLPFSFHDGTDNTASPASVPLSWARRTDVSLTDPERDRDLRGTDLGGSRRSGKLDGPGTGTS